MSSNRHGWKCRLSNKVLQGTRISADRSPWRSVGAARFGRQAHHPIDEMVKDAAHGSVLRTSDFIGIVAIVCGAVIEYLFIWDWSLPLPGWQRVSIGLVVGFTGLGLLIAGKSAFNSTDQSPKPGEPTVQIIMIGVFRFTRNPIYLGLGLTILGLGITFNFISWIVLSMVSLVAIHYLLVIPEEEYLLKKFPTEYSDYMRKVRRWI